MTRLHNPHNSANNTSRTLPFIICRSICEKIFGVRVTMHLIIEKQSHFSYRVVLLKVTARLLDGFCPWRKTTALYTLVSSVTLSSHSSVLLCPSQREQRRVEEAAHTPICFYYVQCSSSTHTHTHTHTTCTNSRMR